MLINSQSHAGMLHPQDKDFEAAYSGLPLTNALNP